MTKKRIISFVLVVLLLIGVSSAVASTTAGTASDPLISLQYITDTYINQLLNKGKTMLDSALSSNTGSSTDASTGSFTTVSLAKGSTLKMDFGGSVIINSGSATISIASGSVINVTRGLAASNGSLNLYERYMAVEDSSATVTLTSAALVAYDGAVTVTQASANTTTFSDVAEGYWAYSYIEKLASAGYINGTGNGKFSPSANMTRADFVTILGRIAGVNTASYTGSSFSDVAVGQYYTPYIEWAVKAGIVSGVGGGKFSPTSNITRSQMAVILVNYASYAGITLSDSGTTTLFADDSSIESWASDSVYTARNAGIISGKTGNIFDPQGNAKREEVCAVLCRMLYN